MLAEILVFVSYAHADRTAALDVAARLRAAGCQVWMENSIAPGRDWRREIERAIDRSDLVVAVVSRSAYRSRDVRQELARAERTAKRIVPVWAGRASDMPLNLEALQRAEMATVGDLCRPLGEKSRSTDGARP